MTVARRVPGEKRSHPRVAIEMVISCEQAGAPAVVGMTRDLGIGGAFIESATPPPFGAAVVIIGRLPGTKNDLRLPAIVRWVKADGFGVHFGSLGPRETHAILTIFR